MSFGLTVRRGGRYNRLVDPDWHDPLDTSYSKLRGARWNPPGSFGALYLNRDERMARIQVQHKLAGRPYGIEDLDPREQHDLVTIDVPRAARLDCVTDDGLVAVGLPATYPVDGRGGGVGHSACQAVGQRAYDAGMSGIACRSAATGAGPDDEELAVFDTHTATLAVGGRVGFVNWFLGDSPRS